MRDYSYKVDNSEPEQKKRFIRSMFDSIVPTYDLLNRLLSMGIDRFWRRFMVRQCGPLKGEPVLDLCCGTGDLSMQLFKAGADLVSLDFSLPMLQRGLERKWLRGGAVAADAVKLPFKDGSFKVLTIAFGIRNIPDLDRFTEEVFRVTGEGGCFVILELTRPGNPLARLVYSFYLRFVLPVVGGLISGKREAYRYLARTIETFLDPEDLAGRLKAAGFSGVHVFSRTFGIATVLVGRKSERF